MKPCFFLPILFLITGLITSSCASKNPIPNPSQTASPVGASAQKETPDWIPNQEIAFNAATEDGLMPRSTQIDANYGTGLEQGANSGANYQAGPNPNALSHVFFGFNQSAIAADQRSKIQSVADQLKADNNLRVLIEGHCDWRGTVEYNLALGERRANSVVQYLSTLGIPKNRMETLSKGDLQAIIEGTREEMRQDRRADIIPLR